MKIIEAIFKVKGFLLLLIIFATAFSFTFAQSEKVFQNPEKYKLVFVHVGNGKLFYKAKEEDELVRARHSHLNNFIERLNEEGKKGYKLVSAIDSRLALVRQDETRYEYDWFETNSSFHFIKSGLQRKLEAASEKGFRIVYHSLLSSYCEPVNPQDAAMGENCK
jgi:hypothetical protein